MKKILSIITLFTFLFSLFPTKPVYASGNNKIVHLQTGQLSDTFTFDKLGYSEKLLVGPFASTSLSFGLPANKRLASGSSIYLQYALAWSGSGVSNSTGAAGVGGTLLVYFNDELIDTLILSADSPLEMDIPIPDDVLNKVDANGLYNLRFFLNAEVNCTNNEIRTTVIISKDSEMDLAYEDVTPPVDLSLFPRPIYQPDSIIPNSTLVVIPDNPEPSELQAALAAMAGLGSITEGNLNVSMVVNSALTPELAAANHMIFVGLANKFSVLKDVKFPVSISDSGLNLGQNQLSDGVVEAAQSPWSPASVVMFVGGNSPEAVTKAGQAFSTGRLVPVGTPDISLISKVNPLQSVSTSEDQTLKDLGYDDETLGLYGETSLTYDFYASPDQAFSVGAYLDLVISHSDLIDFDQTGITVLLNDEEVGGFQLTKESPTTQRIKLVPGVLRRGINRLEIVSNITPHYTCYSADLLSTWVTISQTSVVHMPVSQNKLNIGKNVNLQDFPYMFLNTKDLGNLAFIVAPNDPVSWNYASQVAFYIGSKGNSALMNLHAMYADNVAEDSLKDFNLLIFGKASTLPILSKINDSLPAPFKPGSDEAVEPSMLVNYSLLPGTSVGYLQLLASPWNPDNSILAVLGNTSAGIPMAGATLLKDDLVAKLTGNFAVLYGSQVVSTDTRLGISKDSIISQLPVAVTATPAQDLSYPQIPSGTAESRPWWIIPVFGTITVVIFLLLLVMLGREFRKRRVPKEKKSGKDASS